jgi:hypothetical protein
MRIGQIGDYIGRRSQRSPTLSPPNVFEINSTAQRQRRPRGSSTWAASIVGQGMTMREEKEEKKETKGSGPHKKRPPILFGVTKSHCT